MTGLGKSSDAPWRLLDRAAMGHLLQVFYNIVDRGEEEREVLVIALEVELLP